MTIKRSLVNTGQTLGTSSLGTLQATAPTTMSQPPPSNMTEGDHENEDTYEECLIDLVREYENLWKVTSTKYKDLQRMQNSWEEIAEKVVGMGFAKSAEDCKTKWRYLRDTFKKKKVEYGSGMKSGAAASKRRKWKFFDALNFLNTSTISRPVLCNLTPEPEDTADMQSVEGNETGGIASVDTPLGTKQKSAKERRSIEDKHLQIVTDSLEMWTKQQATPKEQDEFDLFGMSIAISLRKMTRRNAILAKVKLQQVR